RVESLERDRDRADAALDAFGDDLREQVEEKPRVVEPFRGGPVRGVHLFLDAGAMELAEGKSVDREDVAALAVEPSPEVEKPRGIRELAGGAGRQAQSDREGAVGKDAVAHGQRVAFQGVVDLVP